MSADSDHIGHLHISGRCEDGLAGTNCRAPALQLTKRIVAREDASLLVEDHLELPNCRVRGKMLQGTWRSRE